jgi:hypothetical protein
MRYLSTELGRKPSVVSPAEGARLLSTRIASLLLFKVSQVEREMGLG